MKQFRNARQYALEKMGRVERISEADDVRYGAEVSAENKTYLLEVQRKLLKKHKTTSLDIEQGRLLSAALGGYGERVATLMTTADFAKCIKNMAEAENNLEALRETLNTTLLAQCQVPLSGLVDQDLTDALNSKARYDKLRRTYDAACAEQKAQEEKGKKNPKAIEDIVALKREFDQLEIDTRRELHLVNKKTEFMVMEKLTDLFVANLDYFTKGAALLTAMQPQMAALRESAAQAKKQYDTLNAAGAPVPGSTKVKVGPYFGVKLEEILAREGSSVPNLIDNAIRYLVESKSIEQEGIFRLSGNVADLKVLQGRADAGEALDFASVDDANVVAGFIKKWFRELPVPLLTFELYTDFLKLGAPGVAKRPDFSDQLINLLKQLPEPNYKLLARLIFMCTQIAALVHLNKMGSANLATVFGPNILRGREDNAVGMIEGMQAANVIFDALITHYTLAFPGGIGENSGATGQVVNVPVPTEAENTKIAQAPEEQKVGQPIRSSSPLGTESGQSSPIVSDPVGTLRRSNTTQQVKTQTPPGTPGTPGTPGKTLPPIPPSSSKPSNTQTSTAASVSAEILKSPAAPALQSDIGNSSSDNVPTAATLAPISSIPDKPAPASVTGTADRPTSTTDVAETSQDAKPEGHDINTRIQREGSGVLLRDLARTIWGLAIHSSQRGAAPAPLLQLNSLLKQLAEVLREVFPVIKLFVTHHPDLKGPIMDASIVLQDKAKSLIIAAKQVRSNGAGLDGVVLSVQDLLDCVFSMTDACEQSTLDWIGGIVGLVQNCAHHTTKILHIAFGAIDDSISLYSKSALSASEQLFQRAQIAAIQMHSSDSTTLLHHTNLIEELVAQLLTLAEKLDDGERADIDTEARMRDVAKQLAGHFRAVTTIMNKPTEKDAVLEVPDDELIGNACTSLEQMIETFPNEGSMLPHERQMIKHSRNILLCMNKLKSLPLSTATVETHDNMRTISAEIWQINELVENAGKKCTDSSLVDQMLLYKRAVCHYDYSMLLSTSTCILAQAQGITGVPLAGHPSWVPPACAVAGLSASIIPLLKHYFLACLLQE